MPPQAQPVAMYPRHSHAWWMMLIAAALLVIAAFAFGGDALGDIPGMTWLCAALAAWALSAVV